jgi:hypothetical protein
MKVFPGEYNTVGGYTVIIKKSLKDFKQGQSMVFLRILDGFSEIFSR